MKEFFESQFFSSIIGVIIGGILGFGSSFYFYNKQNNTEIKNIAKGYYIEICSLEVEILGGSNIAKNIKEPFRIENGLYTDGLYFHSPSDIFKLKSETAKLLFDFYTSLLRIDKNNKISNVSMFNAANEGTRSILIRLNDELLPALKENLKNNY